MASGRAFDRYGNSSSLSVMSALSLAPLEYLPLVEFSQTSIPVLCYACCRGDTKAEGPVVIQAAPAIIKRAAVVDSQPNSPSSGASTDFKVVAMSCLDNLLLKESSMFT